MKNKKILVGVVLAALLVLPGIAVWGINAEQAGSIRVNQVDEAKLPEMAKISFDEAAKAALQAVPGKLLKIELENENGHLVYGVEVASANRQLTDVKVDAGNAKVLKTEQDKTEREDHESEHSENGQEEDE